MAETTTAAAKLLFTVLAAAFNAAVAADVVVRSPCRGVKLPARRRPTG